MLAGSPGSVQLLRVEDMLVFGARGATELTCNSWRTQSGQAGHLRRWVRKQDKSWCDCSFWLFKQVLKRICATSIGLTL